LKTEDGFLINVLNEENYLVSKEGEGFNTNDEGNFILNPSKYYEHNSSLLMGINSGDVAVGDGVILPRGLTISELHLDKELKIPNLFLGDLQSLKIITGEEYTGYGLYADNVYLNGSLTTKSDTGSYAGVNTINGVSGDKNIVGTTANIIFWSGAKDRSEKAIQDAPFQVTEDGYVYLRNSLIAGGELRAAKIRGWNNGEESALSIYDTSSGISFKTDNDNNE
jgi:hypothetical protein